MDILTEVLIFYGGIAVGFFTCALLCASKGDVMSQECGLYQLSPIDDSVKNGRPISIPVSVRWLPYKAASEQYKKGVKGRWQIANAYGWENIADEPPTHFLMPVDRPVQSSA